MSVLHRVGWASIAAGLFLGIVASAGAPGASAQTPPTACPADLKIAVAAPTAAAPSTVTATITPTLNLKAATAADPTSFHVHYYVDTDPTKSLKPGTPIPTGDPKIIHAASTTQDLGALPAGQHTVWVVVGQVSHQACGGADGNIVTGSTTFTTAALQAVPVQAPAPSKTGTGGVEPTRTSALVVLALLAATGLAVAGARRVTQR